MDSGNRLRLLSRGPDVAQDGGPAIELIFFEGDGEVDAAGEFRKAVGFAPGFDFDLAAVLSDVEEDVLVFNDLRRADDHRAEDTEEGRVIFIAEGGERRDLTDEVLPDLRDFDDAIEFELRTKVFGEEAGGGEGLQTGTKFFELRLGQCDAGGLLMTAEFGEQLGHAFESIEEVKEGDAAA